MGGIGLILVVLTSEPLKKSKKPGQNEADSGLAVGGLERKKIFFSKMATRGLIFEHYR